MSLQKRIFHGPLIRPVSLAQISYLPKALIGIDERGVIAFLIEECEVDAVGTKLNEMGSEWSGVEVGYLGKGEFLMPGLIDTHTHAPQYPNMGYGGQYELLDWLTNVTFPTEAKFSDETYAQKTYESVVSRNISLGTTTCAYYGSHHLTTCHLARICHERGQRALVGKCCMDRNCGEIPAWREESAEASLKDTLTFISYVRSLPSPSSSSTSALKQKYQQEALVQPILTPRFAISCSDELLAGLGEIMRKDKEGVRLQTHVSESAAEIVFAKELFPESKNYTDIYDSFGLLNERTILAHCVHLEDDELLLIKKRGSGVSWCATSNLNLRSGIAPISRMLELGIPVSLGTDVSGGYGAGILSSLRQASLASKILTIPSLSPSTSSSSSFLSLPALFYLATMGGAQVCSLERVVGGLKVGEEFDALMIRTQVQEGEEGFNPALFVENGEEVERGFEKFIYCGDDRNIARVFVRGREIGGSRSEGL